MDNKKIEALAKRLVEAGWSDCTFSDFETYPMMVKEFPEVEGLTESEEDAIVNIMENLIGF